MDNRLNPDFIMSNVVNIFNQKSIIKKYKVIYDDLEAHVEQIDEDVSAFIVVSGSNNNDTISHIFKSIGHMIQLNCPNNNCDINFYNILQAIDQFINIIYEISGINYDIKNLTYKINSNNNIKNHNNNIEDDIESYLGGKYRSKIK